MTRHIPEMEWPAALQDFTNRNAGRATVLDEIGPLGAQEEQHGYPLRGVSFDHRSGQVEIMLGDLEGTEHHLTRSVDGVRAIDVWSDDRGRDLALRLERSEGATILHFTGNIVM
jgi:hypothetical protein